MPPLTRQRTLESLRSWWSDSNSLVTRGPTINLHAASKPLMKLLYHLQVLDFIKKNRGTPVSEETLQICSDYLGFRELSPLTKNRILWELKEKARQSEDDSHAVVHSPVFNQVTELLESPSTGIRGMTCWFVGTLAFHNTTAVPVLALNPCARLISLLQDSELNVVEGAIYTLSQITRYPAGAQHAVAANILDYLVELLESPNTQIRRWTCWTVAVLAFDESTAVAVLTLNPCVQLVSLLQDTDLNVVEGSIYTLSQITYYLAGAQHAVAANILDYLVQLLESPSAGVQRWTCWTLGWLAFRESTAVAVLALNPCVRLASLLRDADVELVEGSIFALSQITYERDGAEAAVAANTLDHVAELLQSPTAEIREWTCEMLGNLASHESMVDAILAQKPCVQLDTLLQDTHSDVRESAVAALVNINQPIHRHRHRTYQKPGARLGTHGVWQSKDAVQHLPNSEEPRSLPAREFSRNFFPNS